jgi:transitional endoplasmic reticulum ATPase
MVRQANAGHASAEPLTETDCWLWREYAAPVRRLDGETGGLINTVQFGKYTYRWKSHDFIVYLVNGRDGGSSYPVVINQYVLSPSDALTDKLILAAGQFSSSLHGEVWVFDGGFWQKSRELWESVQKSEWEDVILDEGMKKAIIHDVDNFFDSRETYEKLRVPWKRGIIYHGPPGNGKTISIKAMMHSLYKRKEPIPTLYVRSLASV